MIIKRKKAKPSAGFLSPLQHKCRSCSQLKKVGTAQNRHDPTHKPERKKRKEKRTSENFPAIPKRKNI